MNTNNSSLEALIQQRIDADTDFQTNLDSLPDEEKDQALADKKTEVSNTIFEEERQAKAKAEEIAKNQKIRAEKAEAEAKGPKKEEGFSLKDTRALQNVHDDDVDFVTNWAKTNKMEIADAVKDDDVKTVLRAHEEKRKTAEATNTGGGRRGTQGVPAEVLVEKANKGELKDDEMQKAARAVMEQRRAEAKT